MKRGSEMCWRKKRRKSHRRNAVKSVILKSKKYKNKKKQRVLVSVSSAERTTKKKLREVNFRGGWEEGGSDLEKHTFAEWVYFRFYTKLTGFWYHMQHCMFSLKGTNCAVSRRGSFGTDFRQVQRNMKSESTRQPPLALTTGSHLLPVNLHHCEFRGRGLLYQHCQERIKCHDSVPVITTNNKWLLTFEGFAISHCKSQDGKSAVWGIQNGDLLRLFKPNKALQWQPDLFIMMLFVSPVVFQHDLHQFPLYSLSTSVKENLTGQDFTKITAKWKK